MHAPPGGGEREVGVGGDGGADHRGAGAGGVEERPEVGGLLGEFTAELVLGERGELTDPDEPDQALSLEAADVLHMPAAVAAGAA